MPSSSGASPFPVVARLGGSTHSSVGFGPSPRLSGLEILIRTHIFLGHASLPDVLRTLQASSGLRGNVITKADINAFAKLGCSICDTAKMRRPAFPAAKDHTPPPIGKKWVFDTLHLRVPSAQFKFMYITRFINIIDGGNGKRRSYGHKTLTEDELEGLIQKLRAFVRPYHGEIHIVKHDSLPALTGRKFDEYLDDCSPSLKNETSPPYVHEGIGSLEVTWQWDVPRANALLMGRNDDESHFVTAFYDCERSGNRIILASGQSRDMVFYGQTGPDVLSCHLVYGSPVKFLVHPEVRDSKFDDHATPGIYRGPSRDDESDHRCWVQEGTGAALRHVTVDIGCMRINERSILSRCQRNNVGDSTFCHRYLYISS